MFSNKKWSILLGLVVVASMLLSACGPTAEPQVVTAPPVVVTELVPGATSVVEVEVTVPPEVVEIKETVEVVKEVVVTATPEPSKRTGAWVDMLVFTEQNSAEAAVKQLQANDIDIYAYSVGDADLFQTVSGDPNLSYTNAFGSYTELTFNVAGPEFVDGRLNPFSSPKVREAMNWLIDRDYMVQEIYGGLGKVKYTSVNSAFPDYAKYVDVFRAIETYYAYNPDKANEVITAEMEAMGAKLVGGKWTYNDAPVVIIALIRTEDERTQIGDYVCNQLESVGFTTDRQYKTRTECSPIWIQADPKEGQMHFYTGGWITTAVSRDDATNFGYFYTNLGSAAPLWQAYVNTPEFYDACQKLWINDFTTLEERRELFETALWGAQQDSARVWLVDQLSFSPQNAKLEVAYDLAGGVAGSQLMPSTIRWTGQEGGTVRIAQPGVLIDPWNPINGSNWIYDQTPGRATGDRGVMSDPYTGLTWPQRIEGCDIVVKEGLPVAKTLDWLTLTFEPKIEVPAEAWVDWDAANQKFITAAE
ncbi:MAG: ABC transporter substrate-binding protein, partial [Anaerolineae bacterium]|nr:ABC transporter substrate-binding protein [Anaerolineae bacterium]